MRNTFLLICVLLIAVQTIQAGRKNGNGQRDRKCGVQRCRAGQKCTTQTDGKKVCTCRQFCPQKKFLVCGSDGRTYFNKCELHRIACVEKRKLKITSDGACPSDNDVPVKSKEKKSMSQKLPLVCYQIERDELRQLLVDWIKRRVVKESKTYQDVVKEMFRECDQDQSNVLDADELLRCTERDGKDIKDTDAHILRGLCVDALISITSSRNNWVLTEAELAHLLQPNFVPPTKDIWKQVKEILADLFNLYSPLTRKMNQIEECQLEDRKYRDGAETKVDCNVCVCACGDWVCTGAPCGKQDKNPGIPGPVTRGRLPSVDQRETFLNGFKASVEVNVPAVQDEVATKQHSRDVASQLDGLDRKPQV